jgi:hypothetical protein
MTIICGSTRSSRTRPVTSLVTCLLLTVSTPAWAQQTTAEILSFLLTNRTIITGDFDRDAQAAAATRDTIAGLLVQEIATLPVSSSSGGFTYRLDSTLGTFIRSSESFGPFYTERSLTAGLNRASFGVGYQSTLYNTIDGRDLRDGTLVSTAAILRGDTVPFDIETVSLRIRTDTMTVTGNYGVADRVDVGVAVPFVRLSLQGERVDTYRGQVFPQATASASASGLASSTTSCVTERAASRSAQRPGFQPAMKRTCSVPERSASRRARSGRWKVQSSGSMASSPTRFSVCQKGWGMAPR